MGLVRYELCGFALRSTEREEGAQVTDGFGRAQCSRNTKTKLKSRVKETDPRSLIKTNTGEYQYSKGLPEERERGGRGGAGRGVGGTERLPLDWTCPSRHDTCETPRKPSELFGFVNLRLDSMRFLRWIGGYGS